MVQAAGKKTDRNVPSPSVCRMDGHGFFSFAAPGPS
jgi:hypothetical protein